MYVKEAWLLAVTFAALFMTPTSMRVVGAPMLGTTQERAYSLSHLAMALAKTGVTASTKLHCHIKLAWTNEPWSRILVPAGADVGSTR
jgi:hypothetical protein